MIDKDFKNEDRENPEQEMEESVAENTEEFLSENGESFQKELMEKFQLVLENQKKEYELKINEKEEKIKELKRENLMNMENMTKRTLNEIKEGKAYALEKFSKDLLLVLDAIKSGIGANPDNYEKFLDGLKMTQHIFLNILEKHHIEIIKTQVGDEFNEAYHECLSVEGEGNHILQVVSEGYMYNGRVLRAAQVIVGEKK